MTANISKKQNPPIGWGFNLTNPAVIAELKTLQFNMSTGIKWPIFSNFYMKTRGPNGEEVHVDVDWKSIKEKKKTIKYSS
jgi:hypothetical protein